ncbi:hypothetical protein PCANB_002495 [Pneumocystis canis]|nr:hypothetical protein PCANB_002495 [Pneumocystis canis]
MISIERPFGIYLWLIFCKIWEKCMGYPLNKFIFIPGKTFLSSWKEVISIILLYYIVIFLGQWIMKSFSPKKFNTIFQIYNLFLSILSGFFFLLLFEQMFPIIWKHGLYYSICDVGSWTQSVVTIYYMNYLIKYIELMDTVFLCLKKKRLQFLHCYHHGATIFLCFVQLIGQTPVSYIPIFLNLGVHVVMYFAYNYASFLPNFGNCSGEEFAAFTGCFLLSSYLVLFISFYSVTYGSKSSVADKKLSNKNLHFNKNVKDVNFKDLNSNSSKSSSVNNIGMTTRSRKI